MNHKAIRIAAAILRIDPSLHPIVNGILNTVAGYAIVPAIDRASKEKTWAIYPIDGSAPATVIECPDDALDPAEGWRSTVQSIVARLSAIYPEGFRGAGHEALADWLNGAITWVADRVRLAQEIERAIRVWNPEIADDRAAIGRAVVDAIVAKYSVHAQISDPAIEIPSADEIAEIFARRYLSNPPEDAGRRFLHAGCTAAFRGIAEEPSALQIGDGMAREYWRKGHAIGRSLVTVRSVVVPDKDKGNGEEETSNGVG